MQDVIGMLLRIFGIQPGNVYGTSPPDFTLGVQANSVSLTKAMFGALLRMASPTTGLTALAGGGQTGATALVPGYNNFTTVATAADSAKLPTAVAGLVVKVRNSGAASMAVFPFSADSINALAINLSVDVLPLCTVTFFAINDTVWYAEIGKGVYLQAPTTQTGGILWRAAANAANYLVEFVNASFGQATVITVPDPGQSTASVMLTAGAQTVAGVQTYTAINIESLGTTITAGTTQTQAGATVLTKKINNITVCANANDGVAIPAAVAGKVLFIRNGGAQTAKIWPAVGSSGTINGGSANAAITLATTKNIMLFALDSTAWIGVALD